METRNIIATASSDQTSQIITSDDAALSSPLAILDAAEGEEIVYLRGIRFVTLAALISIMVFIVSVEANVAVTSFVTITRDLGGFETISWVLSGYQLGFVVFSAGCAAAQTMTALIVVRAFQGLGGGGCYTLASILIVDSAPPEKYAEYVTVAGIAIALGTILGPIIGGAITENTTWRWIFLFNVPIGALALFLVLLVILSIALLAWERHVTLTDKVREPVLPWRFFTNRVMIGILLVMMLVGAPMGVTTFQLPQRFQLVNGLSSLDAGIRLLPFGAVFPVGCMVGTIIAGKFKVPAIYLIFVGSIFQIIGYALLSTLGTSACIETAVYGYLIICGFGCGLTFAMAYIMVPFTVDLCDKAVGMASANQFRAMGSAIGLAVATSVFNGYTLSHFADLGINGSMTDLITGQSSLLESVREDTRRILSEGYNPSGRDDVRGISGNTLQYLHGHGLTVYHHCTVVPSIAEEPTVNGAVNSTTTSNSNDSNTGSTQLKLLPMPILLIRSATDSNALDRRSWSIFVTEKLRAVTEITSAMIVANIPEHKVPAYSPDPTSVTLPGSSEANDFCKVDLDQRGIFAQKLNTSVAYHYPAMLAVTNKYTTLMGSLKSDIVRSQTSLIQMISSVTGHLVSPELLSTDQYWVDNMVSSVRFADATKLLEKKAEDPHPALRRPAKYPV
ncbi:hypothetical protein BPOR_0420g00020 [Botrytis porri]|uniref:Major facilitator superfamily (MFS) profile domain-containing protein n=1 Tax=Botrytis porri TaxID=87229 RepID=A0A4Z1KLP6_9HELO|nr:hypothetical protein BPOR_0420g00020 [Botrytis porri]